MRVVAGEARGRKITAPAGSGTRPTSDRVRESIFNMLFSLDAVENSTVLDLYAGCGALGIEALSRGARSCTFVENNRRAVRCINENLASLDYGQKSTVIEGDVEPWLDRATDHFDLVLADPPYSDEGWMVLLDLVDAKWLVLETDRVLPEHELWDVAREKSYGTTVVTVLRRRGTAR